MVATSFAKPSKSFLVCFFNMEISVGLFNTCLLFPFTPRRGRSRKLLRPDRRGGVRKAACSQRLGGAVTICRTFSRWRGRQRDEYAALAAPESATYATTAPRHAVRARVALKAAPPAGFLIRGVPVGVRLWELSGVMCAGEGMARAEGSQQVVWRRFPGRTYRRPAFPVC